MDRRIDRHPVTVADILCESTNRVAALAGVQLGRQSQLILPRYLGVLTLLRCLGRVPQPRSVLRPLRAFRHHHERILNTPPAPGHRPSLLEGTTETDCAEYVCCCL